MDTLKQAIQEAGLAPRPTDIDLAKYLASGGRCVILGGRTTNFTDQMRRHAQFEFWDSTDPKVRDKPLPSNARVLLVTGRFHDHGWEKRIRKQAVDRGIYCPPGWQSTGDIREIAQRFLDSPSAKVAVRPNGGNGEVAPATRIEHIEPAPKVEAKVEATYAENVAVPGLHELEQLIDEPLPEVDKNQKGWLNTFIAQHADLDAYNQMGEARRVLALLNKAGGTSTVNSIAQGMLMLRKKAGKSLRKDRVIHGAGILKTLPPPNVARNAVAAAVDGFDGEIDAAMSLAEDATRRIDDAREAMALAIDALKKLQREDKTRRERIAKIRAALEQ